MTDEEWNNTIAPDTEEAPNPGLLSIGALAAIARVKAGLDVKSTRFNSSDLVTLLAGYEILRDKMIKLAKRKHPKPKRREDSDGAREEKEL